MLVGTQRGRRGGVGGVKGWVGVSDWGLLGKEYHKWSFKRKGGWGGGMGRGGGSSLSQMEVCEKGCWPKHGVEKSS